MADPAFLSFLNVSENQLHGQILQGKQFNTFGNDSYEGNKGLYGFPVPKGCSNNKTAPSNVLEKDGSKANIAFGWEVVLIGYGCGVVFGMAMGCVIFQHEKGRRRKAKRLQSHQWMKKDLVGANDVQAFVLCLHNFLFCSLSECSDYGEKL
ncbi:hypothetical protein Gotri_026682, partial [Gossypium trilobum]|nr:hypothetical protein [Gossypium trilobum]